MTSTLAISYPTSRIVFDHPTYTYQVADAAKVFFNPQYDHSICREVRGDLAAGVVYTEWTGESIWAHTACFEDNGVNRDLLWVAFDYPFNQLKVQRIFGRVPETNERALRMNTHMGFQKVAEIKGVFPHGVSAIIMCCERPAAERFLKIRQREFNIPTEH